MRHHESLLEQPALARHSRERRPVPHASQARDRASLMRVLCSSAGNHAVAGLLARARGGDPAGRRDGASPRPVVSQPGSARRQLQRKLGLELELGVLVDKDKKDAGTATELGTEGPIRLTTDHASDLKANKGAGPYTSIVELVTPAYEFEAESRVKKTEVLGQLLVDVAAARAIAEHFRTQTKEFAIEQPLDGLIGGAEKGYTIGATPEQMTAGTQHLDAYIQASFGIDLTRISQLYAAAAAGPFKPGVGHHKDRKRVKPHIAAHEDELTILATAPKVADAIIANLGWSGPSPGFAELRGVIVLMVTYLILGHRHPLMGEHRKIDKNIAPFLSRTPLHLLIAHVLHDKAVNATVGLRVLKDAEGVADVFLRLTGRGGDEYLIPEFSSTPECGPWIVDVLNGNKDAFTAGLDSGDFKQVGMEPVGPDAVLDPLATKPGAPPPRGPVLEFRQPVLDGRKRRPPEEWNDYVSALQGFLGAVNRR